MHCQAAEKLSTKLYSLTASLTLKLKTMTTLWLQRWL